VGGRFVRPPFACEQRPLELAAIDAVRRVYGVGVANDELQVDERYEAPLRA
jgi:hypothetical protein